MRYRSIISMMPKSASNYDPDAQAFFNAESSAGVTLTTTQKDAINNLVINLKAANIWSKMNALYPIVGGTATAHKFNLKNPLDTDAAFRLVFSGGWTHSATGMLPNGTNAYANTFFNTNAYRNNNHLSYYIRTNVDEVKVDAGNYDITLGGTYFDVESRISNVGYFGNHVLSSYVSFANTDSRGFYINTRTSNVLQKVFKSGALSGTNTSATTQSINLTIYLGARNANGSATAFSTKQTAFASIGDGLTDLESQVFNQIVEGYQFALGRNINPTQSFYYNSSYNNETNAYLYSTQITDTTIQTATNTLVSDLKTAGIWSKMKAIYPMAGGTATTHKFNLVDSQDTNAAFRLVFSGGWTHNSLGATPNGTNAYADTFLNANFNTNSNHISSYLRTNVESGTNDIGVFNGTQALSFAPRVATNTAVAQNGTATNISFANADSRGLFLNTRTATNLYKAFVNGVVKASSTDLATTINLTFYVGARNFNGTANNYSSRQTAFASIGTGLTDAEAASFYTAVQNFQISLGRAIYVSPPTVSDADAQAFINAATIVDQVESTAVNNLVIGLKADSLWTKMKAVYPMVGSTASSQKYNLVNPLDTNAAFRLTFAGGWTHSFNGIVGNGAAYANTNLIPTSVLTNNSTSFGIYSRSNLDGLGYDTGLQVAGGCVFALVARYVNLYITDQYINSTNRISASNTDSRGFFQSIRTSSTIFKAFKNGSQIGSTNTNASTGFSSANIPFLIGAINDSGTPNFYSTRQYSFMYIGDGLTDSEASNLYNRVQTFNTVLQRQV